MSQTAASKIKLTSMSLVKEQQLNFLRKS